MNMLANIISEEGQAKSLLAHPRLWKRTAIVGTPLVLLAVGFAFWNTAPSTAAAPPVPTVTVASPLVRPIAEWDDYSGRFEASKSVEVRPRVSGAIVGVHFADGSDRAQGAVLFTIDPRPFAAALAEARAAVQGARSDLALAQTDLGRAHPAARSRCGLAQRRRPAARAGSGGEAALAAAQARVQSRALDVGFTQVRAPITGRISDRRDRCRKPRAGRRQRRRRDVADDHQCARPDLLHLRRFGSAVPQGAARARERRSAVRGRDQVAGRGRLSLARPARLHRQWSRHAVGNDPLAAPSSAIRSSSSPPACSATCGCPPAEQRRAARPGCRGADRPGAQDRARRRQGRQRHAASRSWLGPVVDGLRVIRSGLTTADRVVISGTQLAMPGTKVQAAPAGSCPCGRAPRLESAPVPLSGEATLAGKLSFIASTVNPPARAGRSHMRLSRFFITRPIFAGGHRDPHHRHGRDRLFRRCRCRNIPTSCRRR